MRPRAPIVVVWFLAGVPAHADDGARAVTIGDVAAALPGAPVMQVAGHELAAAEALVDAAGAWPAPALRVQTNRLTARVVAGATLPLPLFGTVGATQREAAAQAEATRSQVALDQREARKRAALAWIALARSDGDVAAAVIAAQQAAELERIARGRLDAGTGADVDVTAARAARTRADLAVSAARRAQEAASAELAGVLGWDPARPLRASGDPYTGDARTLDALRARLAQHPERALAERRIAAADATVEQILAQRRPGLALEAQVSFDDPTTPGTDVLVGLSLDLPLFSHLGDRAHAASATAAAERARLAVTRSQLDAGLVAAFRRWQAATDKLAALERDVVPLQERAHALAAQAYREGARDLASALQADRDLAAVRAEVNAARADAATSWLDLATAAGEDVLRAR